MKTLGLIGGTSWVSTIDYYRTINHLINERLGGWNSANLLLYSINFNDFKKLLDVSAWSQMAALMSSVAKKLEDAGASCIVICANTPHLVADEVQRDINIPILHIADCTSKEIVKHNMKKIGLLGTKFTMEHNFFKDILSRHGIETIIPDEENREFIHETIFSEMGKGVFKVETKKKYVALINELLEQGAEGVIFGCTEIPMLLKREDCSIPIFDTAAIHVKYAVEFALS